MKFLNLRNETPRLEKLSDFVVANIQGYYSGIIYYRFAFARIGDQSSFVIGQTYLIVCSQRRNSANQSTTSLTQLPLYFLCMFFLSSS